MAHPAGGPQAVARLIFAGEDKLPAAVPLYGALNWLADHLEQDQAIAGLNLDGPGDPLASLALTLEILSQLQERYPQFPLALTTLGLGLADQVEELARHGAGRITLLVDAVEAETVKKLYRWIRPAKRNMPWPGPPRSCSVSRLLPWPPAKRQECR